MDLTFSVSIDNARSITLENYTISDTSVDIPLAFFSVNRAIYMTTSSSNITFNIMKREPLLNVWSIAGAPRLYQADTIKNREELSKVVELTTINIQNEI